MSARMICRGARLALAAAALASGAAGVELKKETLAAFERYVRQAEARIELQVSRGDGFLFATSPERRASLRSGAILTEARISGGELKAPSGLIHHWSGAVFIPGALLPQLLEFVQAYDRHQDFYQPEVVRSRLLSRHGNDFQAGLRLLKKKALTVVVLETEHAVHYEQRDETRWWARSRSTRIAELENPGTPSERPLPPGTGHGYLWRLNSYWTFQALDGGAYVEIEAISLTRDVPASIRWLIEPIVRTVPRESLANTLRATRDGVAPRRRQ